MGQNLGSQAAVSAIVVLAGSAFIWVGVSFAGYALYSGFLASLGPAWAAAAAAAILLLVPLLTALAWRWHALSQLARKPAEAGTTHNNSGPADRAALALLAGVAKDKPLLALLFAGLLGAAGTVLHHKD